MECHLGQGMSLCRMTALLVVLSGSSHCQGIWLVFQIALDNIRKSCLHFSALLVLPSKVLCRSLLFPLRLDFDQQIPLCHFLFYYYRKDLTDLSPFKSFVCNHLCNSAI